MNEKSNKKMSNSRQNPFLPALNGIFTTFRGERNFRIHVVAALAVVGLATWLNVTYTEWRWIIGCIAIVLITELLNTAVEALVDLVSPDYHPLAKKAKDAAAGAVLIAAVFSAIIGCVIFCPKLWSLFFG
ncbi:undecaprenol kinase [Parapedobacter pyrenivorans]|uniref:Undecaprenol kinase n=2 Tax=Parapedobacter pyrenivorans TaxID=1305674 RepID=A0A917I0E0_9SPHI|nr:undecaprenol kinase [Parapedobacter pyrenivorans]